MSVTFKSLGLDEKYVQVLEQQEITVPTPIQARGIPSLLGGNSILGLAQTGSGKTLAYGLPMLQQVDSNSLKTQALVLCPTRELANQVATEIKKFTRETHGFYTTAVYGGESIDRQIKMLRQGSQIVIGTPGRIIDHLKRGTLKLDDLKYVVLDEADEMLSMGFEEDIRLILDHVNTSPQIALFSATMSREIRQIANQYLGKYDSIEIAKTELTKPNITQHFLDVHSDEKAEVVYRLIKFHGFERSIAFTNTKLGADKLVQQLAEKGYPAEAIHGDMAQLQRTTVMKKFKNGQIPLLVATDVAARGIDVNNIEAVFNVDVPRDTEYYVHRIGRTGRAGKAGMSFALATRGDVRLLKQIERFTGDQMAKEKIPTLQAIAYQQQSNFLQTLRMHTVDEEQMAQWMKHVEQLEFEGFDPKQLLAYMIGTNMGPAAPAEDPLLDRSSYRAPREGGRESRDGGRERESRGERERSYGGNSEGGRSYGRSESRGGSSYGQRDNAERPERKSYEKDPARDTERMVKIKFNIGRNGKIRPQDLVGAIASEANVSGKRLGYIDIAEKFSFVDVPETLAPQIVAAMRGNQVRGKLVKVEMA